MSVHDGESKVGESLEGPADAATAGTAAERGVSWPASAAAALVTAVVLLVIGYRTVRLTPGHLTYALDDAHIHLRLAQTIAHGTYGILPGEPAAPSSSILWPFVLAPFGRFRWVDWMPLVLGTAAATTTVVLVHRCLCVGWNAGRRAAWLLVPLAVAVVLAGGVFVGVIDGMEHTLQVMLSVAMVLGLIELRRGSVRGAWWLWAALMLLPLVRYEGLLTVAIGVTIATALGAWKRAFAAAAAGIAAVAGFSLFLVLIGLPALPSSVLAKRRRPGVGYLDNLRANFHDAATAPATGGEVWSSTKWWLVLAVIAVVLLCVALRGRALRDLAVLATAGAAVLLGAQMVFAQTYSRYVAHALVTVMVTLAALAIPTLAFRWRDEPIASRRASFAVAGVAFLSIFGGAVLVSSAAAQARELLDAPMHARGIYDQQYQLHRLVTEQLEEPVAVNDLGHIAFDNPDRVVDLWGLGDSGARVARFEAADGWMAQIMDERDVEVAIVYKPWFSGSIPKDWILVAKQYNPLSEGGPALRTVHLYATDEAAADRLAAALDRFEPTFPDRTTYEIFRPAPAAG